MRILCSECGKGVASVCTDELLDMASDSVSMWKDVRAGENAEERGVRDVPRPSVDWGATFAAQDILNHAAFDILFSVDFKTNVDMHRAYEILCQAKRHVLGLLSTVDEY